MSQANDKKKPKLIVSTIEECTVCGEKLKRPFAEGDYITKDGGKCAKCGNLNRIILIYAENPPNTK
jgi:hypothetical protein